MKKLSFCFLALFCSLLLFGKYSVTDIYAYEYIEEPEEPIVNNNGLFETYMDSSTVTSDLNLYSCTVFNSDFQSDSNKAYAFYTRQYFNSASNSSFFYDISDLDVYRGFYNQSTTSNLYWFEFSERYDLNQKDGECMFFADNSYTLTFTKLENKFYVYNNDDFSAPESICYLESADFISVRGYGYDREWVLFDDEEVKVDYIFNSDNTYDLRIYVNAPFDIYFLRIRIGYNDFDISNLQQNYLDSSKYSIYQSKGSTTNTTFICHENTSDKGLLKTIIQWLKDIKDSIVSVKDSVVNLPSKIAAAIKSFFDNIVQALSDLGEFIKGIFIPNSDKIDNLFDEITSFFEEKFGIIFQIEVIFKNFFNEINVNSKKEFIELPTLKLNFGDSVFKFGGQTVRVIPQGFENIIIYLKNLINLICTVGFINTFKHKLEKFFGGI